MVQALTLFAAKQPTRAGFLHDPDISRNHLSAERTVYDADLPPFNVSLLPVPHACSSFTDEEMDHFSNGTSSPFMNAVGAPVSVFANDRAISRALRRPRLSSTERTSASQPGKEMSFAYRTCKMSYKRRVKQNNAPRHGESPLSRDGWLGCRRALELISGCQRASYGRPLNVGSTRGRIGVIATVAHCQDTGSRKRRRWISAVDSHAKGGMSDDDPNTEP